MSALIDVNKVQSMPTGDGMSVVLLVIKDLLERNELGQKKYGTILKTANGRDALLDLYQELLDATQYIRQYIEDRNFIDYVALGNLFAGLPSARFWFNVIECKFHCQLGDNDSMQFFSAKELKDLFIQLHEYQRSLLNVAK